MSNISKGIRGYSKIARIALVLAALLFGGVFFGNQWSIEVRLNGSRVVEVEYGTSYEDEGAQAYLCGSLILKEGFPIDLTEVTPVDYSKKGKHNVFYYAEFLGQKSWIKRVVKVVDTVAPEIELIEIEGFYTLPGAVYEEEGYTATDNYDGDITERVVREERDGVVYYTVSDSSGNITAVQREIFYDDPIAPELTLSGEAEYTLEVGTVFAEPGYVAIDNVDGDITANVMIAGTVDMSNLGTYILTYTVLDGYQNEANAQRTIHVEDHTPPMLELLGESTVTHTITETYTDPGYTATDNYDGDLTAEVEVVGSVDANKKGTYEITYSVRDSSGNTTTVTRTVVVKDFKNPDIKLKGAGKIELLLGNDYMEPGYIATDNYDGDITSKVSVSGTVNKNKVGTYTLTYTVEDSSGNKTKVTRTVIYEEKEPPKLTLAGDTNIILQAGIKYEEPGYTAIDNYDGNLTSAVMRSGTVNMYKTGTYTLTYLVTDSSGNKATATRTVTVQAVSQPETVVPSGKVIYLTFDDGPSRHTSRLLDILAKYNVKVTFFTAGYGGYAHMMAREAAEGHTVAIHTTSHEYSQIYVSEEAFLDDFYKQQSLIAQYTGIETKLFRFPGGSSNSVSKKYNKGIMTRLASMLTTMGYTYFDWNVDSRDAESGTGTEEIFQNVINGVSKRDVSVVLQHDIKEATIAATEKIIIWGLANGYTFLPLDASSPTAHHPIKN